MPIYGEYRWNVRFKQGMKSIRLREASGFTIHTRDAIHNFKKIGKNLVERITHYFGRQAYGEPMEKYAYYDLSGRRLCPVHLKRMVGQIDLEQRCPVKSCKIISEAYCIQDYERKPRDRLRFRRGYERKEK